MPLDISAIRGQFPFFGRNPEMVYLDNAATAQKPAVVLDAMREYYETSAGNVHRSMHPLAERATVAYESARSIVRASINARFDDEIVFTKNATEAINLVAHSWAKRNLKKGDAVLLSPLEHHSNIIPWMQLRQQLGIQVEWVAIDASGQLDVAMLHRMFKKKEVKLWAVTGMSNVLGTCPPLEVLIRQAKNEGITVLVDASQLIAHRAVDVSMLRCDFLAFSGHKVYGPEGIGVLYGKRELLENMPPFLGGGSMIREVRPTGFTPADPPQRFEAGTPPVANAVGLAAALDWLSKIPLADREEHEQRLLQAALETVGSIPGIHILGPAEVSARKGCVSFTMEGVHAHDIAEALGQRNICIRAGNQCAQPLHEALGIPASARISVSIYNTEEEVRQIGPVLAEIRKILS